ncbi:hypothetical protein TRFO_03429 [Tritrichomonas foetus]|uniref:non-specific serine/threonine protein kinase n=1 Tax=Tritrichomonas foetus TaxID=1144522 RepID=A0A1J4KU53_9EUKA|nr:hypothetical protein TRFO_03429 [Tritrichomonas foetus]|eukprot:OHT13021.1 hypothetical protein TRFO_03429 [Tritrichomonas foetus]
MCDLFRRQPINTKADVWALGCILYKLCTFKDAFGEGANLQILNVKYQWPQNKNINQKFKDICKYIFNTDPSKRPSARDVLAELYRQFPEWVDKKWQQETNTASSSEPFNPFANSQSNSQGQPFDPFGQNQNQNTQKSSSQNTFDPFGQQQQQIQQNNFPQRQNQRQEQFNPFAGGNNNSQSQETTFNPFAQQSSNQNSGTFDPFANVQQAPQQNSSDIKPPSGDGMPPMFNPFAQPQSQQQPRKQQQQPNAMYNPFEGNSQGNTGNDTFDPFSGLSSSNQQQQPVNPQEMFNPFENITPSPQNSGSGFAQPQPQQFNPFDGNSQTRQGPTHQPPKRGIASSMGFDPFGGAPSNAADTVSLMDTDSLLDSPSSSNQANTFATHNTPLQGGFDDISAFSNTQSPHRQPQSQQFHQQLSQPVHSSSNALDVRRAETDPEGFMRQIVNLNEFELSSILFSIHTSNNNSPFILKFLHMSGTNGPKVASSLPPITGPLGDVFASRRELSGKFPQFEGNFSITNFLRQHKENPVPIGQPPVCPESAKMLLSHIENVVSYVRASPTQVAGEEALISYQVTAYVLAKLKQFRINEGYIVNTAIPFFQNQYNQLKRAFTFIKPPMKFPPEPFNFNDENFLKRIRPPQPKSL